MERPKSMALRGELSFLAKRKFSGLRLWWITPCRWHICTTDLGTPTQAREVAVMADERDIPQEDVELLSTSQEQSNQSKNTQSRTINWEDS
jgi:hypothetical protein